MPKPCLRPRAVVATQSIQTCVENAYETAGGSLNTYSVLVPVPRTMHTGGFYWDSHLQKTYGKQKNSVSFDTQTPYAFTTKLALNFKIVGNLSLSPTYSDFFFENQSTPSQRTSLIATTFSIAAKWYYASDAEVPFKKQLWFVGPATTDQTCSAKIK